ncbi:citrate synthase [Psychromicrobium silvestre]|uniref:citrate synthase (unknown stereospecificity) n=1 Tax=Psychromicrobium silvestre TaxID=1645614 RepID=A0A7Y9LUJ0_9MICC|nr:citrate/2-methylcitrate synthase [Psychromicrobium silvestre]NYE95874.1 citrate synthase [Psychromicrobium silvestre]
MTERLSTAQAAARLGVKAATLYAYVSRGLISSERAVDAAGSTFDPLEVETLARRRRSAGAASELLSTPLTGTPLMVMDSPIALLSEDSLYYRGLPAVELAQQHRFENIANWLWSDAETPEDDAKETLSFAAPVDLTRLVRNARRLLGPEARGVDYMQQALLIASSHDPLKRDLSPAAVRSLGQRTMALMIEGLPGESRRGGAIAAQLWQRLAERESEPADVELLNTALILLVDHDLAASTLAGRVAASARAHPYAALMSALAACDSGLHGSASVTAAELLRAVLAGSSPEQAISAQLASSSTPGAGIPGFGHRIYRHRDPRAAVLLAELRKNPHYREAWQAAAAVTAVVHARTEQPVNVDLAIAVLMIGAGMPLDGGQTLFALARTAGWLAHIMDEYLQSPLRLRPRGQYSGPAPQS